MVMRFLAAALLFCGCTSSDGGATSSDSSTPADAGPTVTCQNDSRVDTYVANLTKASSSGQMKVTLVTSDPAPPIRGNNTWSVKVTDGQGAALNDANLTVTPFMPDHGHGTSVKAAINAKGDGVYEITPLYLFMPGVWKITIANGTDSVDFLFCVAG